MLLNFLNAREAVAIGSSLADQFVSPATSDPSKRVKKGKPGGGAEDELRKFVQRIDSDARPLRLNFYKRAKLANSFKWKLLQNGVKPEFVNELTRILLVRLAGK
jgi:hypothetical protein